MTYFVFVSKRRGHYHVIDFEFVAENKISDVIMISQFYHVTTSKYPLRSALRVVDFGLVTKKTWAPTAVSHPLSNAAPSTLVESLTI